jgi:TPR repeat protein/SAM-dependent MidA family methyltransferase
VGFLGVYKLSKKSLNNYKYSIMRKEDVMDTRKLEQKDEKEKKYNESQYFSLISLGRIKYEQGMLFFKEKEFLIATQLFQESANLGYAEGQRQLAACYRIGVGVAIDLKKAHTWYVKAANQGNIMAQYRLATNYRLGGDNVEQDHNQAFSWYMKGEAGPAENRYYIAEYYWQGLGVEKNLKEAAYWYKQAIQKGHVDSIYKLAHCYMNGEGVARNIQQAIHLVSRETKVEPLLASLKLADYYERGTIVPKNLILALQLYKIAADAGEGVAFYKQGLIIEKGGEGVEQNLELAKKYFLAAAERGYFEVRTFDDLQNAALLNKKEAQLLDYYLLVDSPKKLKKLFYINFDLTVNFLKKPYIRNLFNHIDDVQQLFSASIVPESKENIFDFDVFFDDSSKQNIPLRIFFKILGYNEFACLVNIDFILKNLDILITSHDDLNMMLMKHPRIAISLSKTRRIAQFIKIDHFYNYLTTKSYVIQLFAIELARSPYVANLALDESSFLKIASVNPSVAYELFRDPKFAKLTENFKNIIGFTALLNLYPVIKRRELNNENIKGLDLAGGPYLNFPPKTLGIEADTDFNSIQKKTYFEIVKKISTTFMTLKSYFDNMMFGNESGYYSSGRVRFVGGEGEGDYQTAASNPFTSEILAAAFAYQILMCRKNLIAKKTLEEKSSFNVLEGGAGNGNLCFNILTFIEKMANSKDSQVNNEWRNLYLTISYYIGERSKPLSEIQKIKNKRFITEGKLKVINADVKNLNDVLPHKMAAVISNELLDVFPPHQVTMNEKGRIDVTVIIPILKKNKFEKFKVIFTPQQLKAQATFLNKKSKGNARLLAAVFPRIPLEDDTFFLSENDFLKLHKIAIDKIEMKDFFNFISISIDSVFFKEVNEFFENNPQYFSKMSLGDSVLINLGIDDFIKNISEIILINGEIITVDYGSNFSLIHNKLRTYYKTKVGYDIFSLPGNLDITYDVNFTHLVERGAMFGIHLVYFGSQSAMLPENTYAFSIISKNLQASWEYIDEPDNFRVCVQRKTLSFNSSSSTTEGSSEDKRFGLSQQKVTYLELFTQFKKTLFFPSSLQTSCDTEAKKFKNQKKNESSDSDSKLISKLIPDKQTTPRF